jgi:hypothetical protein
VVDQVELIDDARTDFHGLHVAEFEGVGGHDVFGLRRGPALPEHPRLAVVVLEALGPLTDLVAVHLLGLVAEDVLIGQRGAAPTQRIFAWASFKAQSHLRALREARLDGLGSRRPLMR